MVNDYSRTALKELLTWGIQFISEFTNIREHVGNATIELQLFSDNMLYTMLHFMNEKKTFADESEARHEIINNFINDYRAHHRIRRKEDFYPEEYDNRPDIQFLFWCVWIIPNILVNPVSNTYHEEHANKFITKIPYLLSIYDEHFANEPQENVFKILTQAMSFCLIFP